jgi:predicted ATPase/class 3 adenylate cyclase
VDCASAATPDPLASNAVPSGTVTLLFTDIEGSTARWERAPLAMRDALARHDAIVRGQVERFRGHVFKTIGDAFCVVFERPEDAVRAAVEAQLALGRNDFSEIGTLPVRMALHTGANHERDGDYFGPSVNRVARLLATGHGGQILASGITAELVRDRLPEGYRLTDLGIHRLKDLDRSEHVFQVDSPGRAAAFPALRALAPLGNNLPTPLTSFVGREREVAELGALLEQHRLVSIVGSGGIGKTRTSAEVATLQLERFPAGVWFVEMAPLSDGALIPATIAASAGVELAPDEEPLDALVGALGEKRLLLVLDNCEHLIDDVARVVAALTRACPQVSILATSRQPIGIAGERLYRMPTLSFPAPTATVTAASAMGYESIRLFVLRAEALDSRFALTEATAPVVAEICRRLDGIALAIELASARVRVLAPAQLRDRLDKRLKILTSGDAALSPRQQTLRALIDWSFDLLGPAERTLFCGLGIFADSFTLEAAAAVCAAEGQDEFDVLDLLTSLVDKSLVIAEVDREPARYRMLESMRDYALTRLDESGARQAVAARHAAYYAELAEASEREYDRTYSDTPLFALDAELDNVRAALAWAFDGGDATVGTRLLGASRLFWPRWGAGPEGIQRSSRVAANQSIDAPSAARLWSVVSYLTYKGGRPVAALDAAERAVSAARASGDARLNFDAMLCRAMPLLFVGRIDDAEADLRAAERIVASDPSAAETVRLLEVRGAAKAWRHEYDDAAAAFATLGRIHRTNGNVEGEVRAGVNLAECEYASGRTEEAIAVVRAVLPNAETLGRYWHAFVLGNLAGYLVSSADMAAARATARDAIQLSTSDADSPIVTNALEHFALTLAHDGDTERAARLLGYCDATKATNGWARQHTEQVTHDRLVALLEARYDPGELRELRVAGALLSPAIAVETALRAEGDR